MVTNLVPKSSNFFSCEKCDYSTSRKSQWFRHLSTDKHNQVTLGDVTVPQYSCKFCNKFYHSRNGLWRHNQNCEHYQKSSKKVPKVADDICKLTDLILDVVHQNKDLTLQICELSKEKTITNNIVNTNNSITNNNFNLNMFLNETCKNALNLADFIEMIQPQLADLEETGRLGFVKGISKIFIEGLKGLDVIERPIHCSDAKRETLYVKQDDNWSKDNETKDALTMAVKQVVSKNTKQISAWQKKNPGFSDPADRTSDKYMKLLCQTMPGSTKAECDDNYCKIVKNIIKETVIDKTINANNIL